MLTCCTGASFEWLFSGASVWQNEINVWRKKTGQHLKNNLFWGYLTFKKTLNCLEAFNIELISEILMVTFALFTFWLNHFDGKGLKFLGNYFSGTLVGTMLTKSSARLRILCILWENQVICLKQFSHLHQILLTLVVLYTTITCGVLTLWMNNILQFPELLSWYFSSALKSHWKENQVKPLYFS